MEKCKIGVKREAKVAFGGTRFTILVDGLEITTIGNGETIGFGIDAGQHEFGVAIGKKVGSTVSMNLSPGDEVNLICYAKGSKAEMKITPVDVCGLVEANSQTVHPQVIHVHSGNGCLTSLIAWFLVLIGIFLFLCAIIDIA